MTLEATVLIPKDSGVNDAFGRQFATDKAKASSCRVLLLRCHPQTPGVVWRCLRPCLLQSPKHTARRALLVMFDLLGLPLILPRNNDKDATGGDAAFGNDQEQGEEEEAWEGKATRRRLILATNPAADRTDKDGKGSQIQRIIIWIQPPSTTYYDTYFTCALIAYEHQMILYQSLAAWISTLGGGHFFCRHLRTAVGLARLQRRVALLMGDYSMAYKCTINEAYSYIYAGYFSVALKTIDLIAPLNKRVDIHSLDVVILNMCDSAKLFCKRVRGASKNLKSSKTKEEAMTFDDYQRIRVIEDQPTITATRVAITCN